MTAADASRSDAEPRGQRVRVAPGVRAQRASNAPTHVTARVPARSLTRALVTLVVALAVAVGGNSHPAFAQEERSEGYYTVLDEDKREIFMTAIMVAPGDIFIAEDNRAYEISYVEGDRAHAVFLGVMGPEEKPQSAAEGTLGGALERVFSAAVSALRGVFLGQGATGRGRTVVLYNTHSDESYEPTSGTPTKDWGDVYSVAATFESALKKQGFRVVRSTANHNPHDGAAYARSRRTMAQLIRQNPIAAFDIHRDAVPPQAYGATVAGEDVTRITLVVGQQNQTRGQNIQFAKQLKAAADRQAPGLIKGILWAQGDYNQDMLGRSVLLEVGAHTNRLDEAERAVDLFASSIAPVLGAAAPGVGMARGGVGRAVAWLVGIVAVAGGAYLVANSDNWRKIRSRLAGIGARGFLNLLGLRRRRKQ
ncbi:MAG: stage II sporulation protein P [Betaproteobacteria bacterium]